MDPLRSIRDLPQEWRVEADVLRRRKAPLRAELMESLAEQLEQRLREWRLELLTLEQAAHEAGVKYDTIQRKVGSEIQNAGEKGAPRVRRADLHPWLDAPEPELHEDQVEELADKTLQARQDSG